MYIYFYNKNEKIFKHPIMMLEPTVATYKFNEKEFYAEIPLDEEGRWKVVVPDAIAKANEQLYRIKEVDINLNTLNIYGKPIFYDLSDTVLLDRRPTHKDGQRALDEILADTEFTGHSDIEKINTSYYIRKNIVEALLSDDETSFLNRWGGELYLDNFDVYINKRLGRDRGVRVDLGYNLSNVEQTIDINDVITRIIPVGFNEIMLNGEEPWIDSPLINKYSHPKTRVIKFEDIKVIEEKDYQPFDFSMYVVGGLDDSNGDITDRRHSIVFKDILYTGDKKMGVSSNDKCSFEYALFDADKNYIGYHNYTKHAIIPANRYVRIRVSVLDDYHELTEDEQKEYANNLISTITIEEREEDKYSYASLEEAQVEMTERCKDMYEIQKVDEPFVNYKVDMIDIGTTTEYEDARNLFKVDIGDTIYCHIKDLDINISSRVVNYEKDLITGDYISLELGNYKKSYFEIQSDINSNIKK